MLGTEGSAKASNKRANNEAEAGDFNRNVPNLRVYNFADIEVATEGFSVRNKLGEGGYGPVYKVTRARAHKIHSKIQRPKTYNSLKSIHIRDETSNLTLERYNYFY